MEYNNNIIDSILVTIIILILIDIYHDYSNELLFIQLYPEWHYAIMD